MNKMIKDSKQDDKSDLVIKAGLVRFLVIAILLYVALDQLHRYFLADSQALSYYLELVARRASGLLSILGFETILAVTDDGVLRIGTEFGAFIDMEVQGADHRLLALLLAVIAAWPGSWLKRLTGVLTACVVFFIANTVRCAGMLLVDIHIPLSFEIISTWWMPALMIAFIFLYFLLWIKYSGTHPLD